MKNSRMPRGLRVCLNIMRGKAFLSGPILRAFFLGSRCAESQILTYKTFSHGVFGPGCEPEKQSRSSGLTLTGERGPFGCTPEPQRIERGGRSRWRTNSVRLWNVAWLPAEWIVYIYSIRRAPKGEFRKVWKPACEEAGLVGKTPHDFRRSAVRNHGASWREP